MQQEDKALLASLGFAACLKGRLDLGVKLFEDLTKFDPPVKAAAAGLAFAKIITDQFEEGEQMLLDQLKADPENYDLKGMLVLAYALQKKEQEARETAASIPAEAESAAALSAQALSLL